MSQKSNYFNRISRRSNSLDGTIRLRTCSAEELTSIINKQTSPKIERIKRRERDAVFHPDNTKVYRVPTIQSVKKHLLIFEIQSNNTTDN